VTPQELLASARRLQQLTRQLDQSNRPTDWQQITAGVQTEVMILVSGLTAAVEAVEALSASATANHTGKARLDARETSQQAARAVSVRTGSQRGRILVYLLNQGARTDPEIQRDLDIPPSSQRPRRVELVELGLVGPAGTTVRNGQEYTCWAVTHDGFAVARRLSSGQNVVTVPTMASNGSSTVDGPEGDGMLF
jgi:hypothetical protein